VGRGGRSGGGPPRLRRLAAERPRANDVLAAARWPGVVDLCTVRAPPPPHGLECAESVPPLSAPWRRRLRDARIERLRTPGQRFIKGEPKVAAIEKETRAETRKSNPLLAELLTQVRRTPSWPKSWANFSLLQLYSYLNVWANLRPLGQPDTFIAADRRRARPL
jgi:hypothetical protein